MHGNYYRPVLEAFETELRRLSDDEIAGPELGARLAKYIIGNTDFYKVIVRSDQVQVLAFNFNGTLSVPKSKLPSRLQAIDKYEGSINSVNVRMDRGYSLNFRLHSAKSTVEPSFKFDVTAVSLPPSEIYQNHMLL